MLSPIKRSDRQTEVPNDSKELEETTDIIGSGGCGLTNKLQSLVFRYCATYVVKWKWIVLG